MNFAQSKYVLLVVPSFMDNIHFGKVPSAGNVMYSIQPSACARTSKSMLHRHRIPAVTRVMAYVADAVTL
jgi:hypothetical protein